MEGDVAMMQKGARKFMAQGFFMLAVCFFFSTAHAAYHIENGISFEAGVTYRPNHLTATDVWILDVDVLTQPAASGKLIIGTNEYNLEQRGGTTNWFYQQSFADFASLQAFMPQGQTLQVAMHYGDATDKNATTTVPAYSSSTVLESMNLVLNSTTSPSVTWISNGATSFTYKTLSLTGPGGETWKQSDVEKPQGESTTVIFGGIEDDQEVYLLAITSHRETVADGFDFERMEWVFYPTNPLDGPEAYYPFNGNAQDESGYGHDLTVHGATLDKGVDDKPDSAYRVESGQRLATADFLGAESELTVCGWMHVEGFTSGKHNILVAQYPFSAGSWNTKAFAMGAWVNTSEIFVVFYGAEYASNVIVKDTVPVELNTWYFIAATFDNGVATLYVNGKQVNQQQAPFSSVQDAVSEISVGNNLYNEMPLRGRADDVRIYTRALSAKDIKALYNEHSSDPEAYYPLNGSAQDESGNENHGTMVGDVTYVNGNEPESLAAYFDNPSGNTASTMFMSLPTTAGLSAAGEGPFTVAIRLKTEDSARQNGRLFGNEHLQIAYNAQQYSQPLVSIHDIEGDKVALYAKSDSIITDGSWHWYVLVLDRTAETASIYLDGVLESSEDASGIGAVDFSNLRIGAMSAPYTAYGARDTAVDECRIYPRALSAEEIKALCGMQSTGGRAVITLGGSFYIISGSDTARSSDPVGARGEDFD